MIEAWPNPTAQDLRMMDDDAWQCEALLTTDRPVLYIAVWTHDDGMLARVTVRPATDAGPANVTRTFTGETAHSDATRFAHDTYFERQSRMGW